MEIEDLFRSLKPVAGDDLDALWLEYVLADSKSRKEIEDALRICLARDLERTFEETEVLLESPPEELSKGDYPLGMIFYGQKPFHLVGLREKEWIQHLGIFGWSGCGKTNAAFIVVLNFLANKNPFLIFDWKRNYRDLIAPGMPGVRGLRCRHWDISRHAGCEGLA